MILNVLSGKNIYKFKLDFKIIYCYFRAMNHFLQYLVCFICGLLWVLFQYLLIAILGNSSGELALDGESNNILVGLTDLFKNKFSFMILGSVIIIDVFLDNIINTGFNQPYNKNYLLLLYSVAIVLMFIMAVSILELDSTWSSILIISFTTILGIQKAIHFFKPATIL